MNTRPLLKNIKTFLNQSEEIPEDLTVEFTILLVYRRDGGRQLFLPGTTKLRIVESFLQLFHSYRIDFQTQPTEGLHDLLTISIQLTRAQEPATQKLSNTWLRYQIFNVLWNALRNKWLRRGQFILVTLKSKESSFDWMTITQNSALWRLIEYKMKHYKKFNAELLFRKQFPRPPISRKDFSKIEEYYEAVGPYIIAYSAGHHVSAARLNPDTPTGYPVRIIRNVKEVYGTEVFRKKLQFRTSEQFLEHVHELELLSVIPNSHRASENFVRAIIIDLDCSWNTHFSQLRDRLEDYSFFLSNNSIGHYITSTGSGMGFHVYIPVSEFKEVSIILPRTLQWETLLSRRKADIQFLAAHDYIELINIFYSTVSSLGPIAPHSCIFDLDARRDTILFDLRAGRNVGARVCSSLNESTLCVCRIWELESIPYRSKELLRQSEMEFVLQDDLRCLDLPHISQKQREENTRTLSDLAWLHRNLLFDFYKLGYRRFFKKHKRHL